MSTRKKAAAIQPSAVETSLILRCCRADFTSHGGFQWPSTVGAIVEAGDWEQTHECDNGLHGWLFGEGDVGCVDYWARPDARWLVLEVESATIIVLGGKVKFPRAEVVHVGDRLSANTYMLANESRSAAERCIGSVVQVGNGHAAVTGPLGTATAGDSGTATAGDSGTATAGDSGTATAGDSGTATAGDSGTATAGDSGTATAGDSGTATAGDSGTATAGYRGTATAGYSGTATAGDSGTATAGYRGTATAGDRGEIRIRWYDTKADRYRTAIAYVGENGIKPNVAYRLNDAHEFVEAGA